MSNIDIIVMTPDQTKKPKPAVKGMENRPKKWPITESLLHQGYLPNDLGAYRRVEHLGQLSRIIYEFPGYRLPKDLCRKTFLRTLLKKVVFWHILIWGKNLYNVKSIELRSRRFYAVVANLDPRLRRGERESPRPRMSRFKVPRQRPWWFLLRSERSERALRNIITRGTNSQIHHFLPEYIAFNQSALRHFLPKCIVPRNNTRMSRSHERVVVLFHVDSSKEG